MPPKRYVPPRPRARGSAPKQTANQAPAQKPLPASLHRQPLPFGPPSRQQPLSSRLPEHQTKQPTALKGTSPSCSYSTGQEQPSKPAANTLTSDQHDILLRHRLSPPTIHTLISIPYAAPPNVILQKACLATEITSHPILPGEKALFSTLNGSATTIWPIAVSTPTQPWHKAFLIGQNHPHGQSWVYIPRITPKDRSNLSSERPQITSLIRRVLRCAADLAALRHDGVTVRHALELSRSIAAAAWEGETHELQQVKDIGAKKIELLRAAGISTVRALADQEFYNIDRILKRNPPFGSGLIMQLRNFPRIAMKVRFERWAANSDLPAIDALPEKVRRAVPGQRLAIVRARVRCLNEEVPTWKDKVHWLCVSVERGAMPECRRVFTERRALQGAAGGSGSGSGDGQPGSRGELLFFHRVNTKCLINTARDLVFPVAMRPGETLFAWASCEEVVGTLVETEISAPET